MPAATKKSGNASSSGGHARPVAERMPSSATTSSHSGMSVSASKDVERGSYKD
jgi:hypothetical protein